MSFSIGYYRDQMFTYKHQDPDSRIFFYINTKVVCSELIYTFVQQSRASLVGDQFLYSCDLNV